MRRRASSHCRTPKVWLISERELLFTLDLFSPKLSAMSHHFDTARYGFWIDVILRVSADKPLNCLYILIVEQMADRHQLTARCVDKRQRRSWNQPANDFPSLIDLCVFEVLLQRVLPCFQYGAWFPLYTASMMAFLYSPNSSGEVSSSTASSVSSSCFSAGF